MKILHIVREADDERALAMARAHADKHEVALLLLHDAVLSRVEFDGPLFACRDDLAARGWPRAYDPVDYEGIVALICAYDRVISW